MPNSDGKLADGFLSACANGGRSQCITGTEVELDFSSITTGKGVQWDFDNLTTGTGLEIRADADVLTTGYFLRCLGGSSMATDVFTVADGANTGQDVVKITGAGAHTDGYATLTVVNSAAIASDGAALQAIGSGAIASGGNVFRSEATGTPAAGAILNELVFSGTSTNNPELLRLEQKGTGASVCAKSIDAGALGAFVKLEHDSASPADNDVIARISAYGDDDGGNSTQMAKIDIKVTDVTSNTEDAQIEFHTIVGAISAEAFRVDGTAGSTVHVLCSDAGAVGAGIKFNHDSASPADNDVVGRLDFYGDDDGGTSTEMAKIDVKVTDVTSNTEDADIEFHTIIASSLTKTLTVTDGVKIDSATATADLTLTNTNAGATGSIINIVHDSASPADNDVIGRVAWYGDDDGGNSDNMAKIDIKVTDVSTTTEDAEVQFHNMVAGTLTETLTLDATGVKVKSGGYIHGAGTGSNGIVLKDLKNAAATTLSGTNVDVEIDIGGTAYHWTVYPTKA